MAKLEPLLVKKKFDKVENLDLHVISQALIKPDEITIDFVFNNQNKFIFNFFKKKLSRMMNPLLITEVFLYSSYYIQCLPYHYFN